MFLEEMLEMRPKYMNRTPISKWEKSWITYTGHGKDPELVVPEPLPPRVNTYNFIACIICVQEQKNMPFVETVIDSQTVVGRKSLFVPTIACAVFSIEKRTPIKTGENGWSLNYLKPQNVHNQSHTWHFPSYPDILRGKILLKLRYISQEFITESFPTPTKPRPTEESLGGGFPVILTSASLNFFTFSKYHLIIQLYMLVCGWYM